jgi:hypothetical protein
MAANEETANAPADGPAQRVGQVVRRKWHLDSLLGVGGMASVYAATHVNGRRAALKILHRSIAGDPAMRDRFIREGYLGNKIDHPGRVECLDNDETDDGEPYLVMELLEGSPLDVVWKRHRKRMPLVDVLKMVDELLECLAACHAVDLVHRDLKPANVFVTNAGRIKVLDFGIAQLREAQVEHTRAGLALGTPSFMSPEQARGGGDRLDGRADLFSVGAMMYALISGKRLHKGRTSDESLIMAATQPATSLATVAPDLPVEVIALVDKALAWDRRNRFANALEMREEVRRVLSLVAPEAAEPIALATPQTSHVAVRAARPAEPVAAVVEAITADHPDVVRMNAVFKQVERALPSVRQYGFSHPETGRRIRGAFEEIAAALRDAPRAMHWTVRPYSFAHRGFEIWEPTAPLDVIPYTLFEAGMRTMRLTPGFSEAELRKLLELLLLDPTDDLPPEDDLVTVLWDMALPHVVAGCADVFADGDGAAREAFFEQSDAVEQQAKQAAKASRAEARAMAVSTDASARGATRNGPLGLDPTARIAIAAQLEISAAEWQERYVDALVDGYLETRKRGDSAELATALGAATAANVGRGKLATAMSLHAQTVEVAARRAPRAEVAIVRGELSAAMMGGGALELTARALTRLPEAERDAAIDALLPTLDHLGASDVPAALAAMTAVDDPRLLTPILRAVDRYVAGNEQAVESAVAGASPEVARALLAILGRARTPASTAALARLAEAGDADLRVEAAALRAPSPDHVKLELGKLVEHDDPAMRLAALRAMAQRRIMDAGPVLVRRIEDPSFHDLSRDERETLLRALSTLNPTRAETLAAALLAPQGVLKRESREQTRVIAARYLADTARTPEGIAALEAAAKKSWLGSDEVRSIAEAGLAAAKARVGGAE